MKARNTNTADITESALSWTSDPERSYHRLLRDPAISPSKKFWQFLPELVEGEVIFLTNDANGHRIGWIARIVTKIRTIWTKPDEPLTMKILGCGNVSRSSCDMIPRLEENGGVLRKETNRATCNLGWTLAKDCVRRQFCNNSGTLNMRSLCFCSHVGLNE